MEFLKKFNITGTQFIKGAALLAILLIVLSVISKNFLYGVSFSDNGFINTKQGMSEEMFYGDGGITMGAPTLSVRNVATDSYMPVPQPSYTPGNDAENFEVREYNATIETRNLEEDCEVIQALKKREDVIFENTSAYDHGCSYTFKVKKNSVEAVLAIINERNPKSLNESTYTIKREVTDYTGEIEILQNKLATLDKTLADALASYDNVTTLANNMGNVESLAKIIDSKLAIIERLTLARIDTNSQLERLERAKSEALDRLEYTYFYVQVYENKFIDGEEMKNSWKAAVQQFVREVNNLFQDLSIGFVTLLLLIVKFALYGIVLLFAARFGWSAARNIWINTGK
jgi:hypothetical protein